MRGAEPKKFFCKLRGICPSCNTRRMSNTAAHLVDHVIAPDVTLRQWVLTVPFELRLLLAAKPAALSAVGRIFIQEIASEPMRLGDSYVIPRRIEPSLPRHSVSFELAEPEHPNIAFQLAPLDVDSAIATLAPFVRSGAAQLQLDAETAQRFTRLHQSGPLFESTTPVSAKTAAYSDFQRNVEELLGSERYAHYRTGLDAYFERLLLARPGID